MHFEYDKFLALLALPYLLYFLLGETLHQMRPTAFDQAGRLRLQLELWQMKEKWDSHTAGWPQVEAEAKAEAAAERQARERSHKKSVYEGLQGSRARASKERAAAPAESAPSAGGPGAEMV